MVTKAEYLLMANDAYRDLAARRSDDEDELPESLKMYGWTDVTYKTVVENATGFEYNHGFFARVYTNSITGQFVIAYRGTDTTGGTNGGVDPAITVMVWTAPSPASVSHEMCHDGVVVQPSEEEHRP